MNSQKIESCGDRQTTSQRFNSASGSSVSTPDFATAMNCSADGDPSPHRPQPSEAKELWQFRSYLIRQARGITGQFGGKINSSDLVQQTLLEAWRQLDQFRGRTEGELAKWLNQMLSNNITDAARALRRQKRDIAREQSLDNSGCGTAGKAANWIGSEQTSPSNCVHNAEQLLRMSKAISMLPAAQQEVVVLHHLQGQSLAEVAVAVDRTPAAVAGLLYRGLKSLRSALAES